MSAPVQVLNAITQNLAWKMKLRNAVQQGRSEITVDDACRDDRCEFGRWVNRTPPDAENQARHKQAVSAHKRFHEAAGQVLSLATTGKADQARLLLEGNGNFESASNELTKLLETWPDAA